MTYTVIALPMGTSLYRYAVIDEFDEEFARFFTKDEAEDARLEAAELANERAADAFYSGDRDFTAPYEP